MSLVEHCPAPEYKPLKSDVDECGHVTNHPEIPKMDPELDNAVHPIDLAAQERDISPCEHAIARAQAILELASNTADLGRRADYLQRAQAEIDIAKELLGFDLPLDNSSYGLAA